MLSFLFGNFALYKIRSMAKKTDKRSSRLPGEHLYRDAPENPYCPASFFLSRIFFYLFNFHYFSGLGFGELMKIFLSDSVSISQPSLLSTHHLSY